MLIDKDTQVCISISSDPSNTGTKLHNACYRSQSLNFLYKAFQVTDLDAAISGVRALKIRGCSVSMPFKQQIIGLIDELDPLAQRVGAVNTVLNQGGHLLGYNTDASGAIKTIERLGLNINDEILILGAGGMARALIVAFQELKINKLNISSRDPERASKLADSFSIKCLEWNDAKKFAANVLVNATPIGMPGYPCGPIFIDDIIKDCHTIIDVVVDPSITALEEAAVEHKKKLVNGLELTKAQMMIQYEIYTGLQPPLDIIERALSE